MYKSCRTLSWIAYGLLLAAAIVPAFASAQTLKSPDAQKKAALEKAMHAEKIRNVGKQVPAELYVLNAKNQRVALRDVLHGPSVLVKVDKNCLPCKKLVSYIRRHGDSWSRTHAKQLVVLSINSANGRDLRLPSTVQQLHIAGPLLGGFLGGTFTPSVFFFDKNLTLRGRHLGFYKTAQQTLQYSGSQASGDTDSAHEGTSG